jgi:hypothetical protein
VGAIKNLPSAEEILYQLPQSVNPMKAEGKLESVPLGRPSPAASLAFVVWKNDKLRVVIDLR